MFLLSFEMIVFSYQASNNYVLYGFRRNTVASYQENLESAKKGDENMICMNYGISKYTILPSLIGKGIFYILWIVDRLFIEAGQFGYIDKNITLKRINGCENRLYLFSFH